MISIDSMSRRRSHPAAIRVSLSAAVAGAALPIASLLRIAAVTFNARKQHGVPCVADCLIAQKTTEYYTLLIVPLFLLLVQGLLTNDFLVDHVLRRGSKRRLWRHQVAVIVKTSALYTLYYTLCTLAISPLYTTGFLNWDSTDSYFFVVTQGVNTRLSFGMILLFFGLSCFLTFVLMGSLFLAVWWLSNQRVLGWIFIVAVTCADIFVLFDYSPFYHLSRIDFYRLEPSRMLLNHLLTALFGAAVAGAGFWFCHRKEFLNESTG